MMRLFAERGIQGVSVQLFDEFSGDLSPGSYQIDEKLRFIQFLTEDTCDSHAYSGPSQIAQIDKVG